MRFDYHDSRLKSTMEIKDDSLCSSACHISVLGWITLGMSISFFSASLVVPARCQRWYYFEEKRRHRESQSCKRRRSDSCDRCKKYVRRQEYDLKVNRHRGWVCRSGKGKRLRRDDINDGIDLCSSAFWTNTPTWGYFSKTSSSWGAAGNPEVRSSPGWWRFMWSPSSQSPLLLTS